MPKNILDFPEQPPRPKLLQKKLKELASYKWYLLAFFLAIATVAVAVETTNRKTDILIGMSLFMVIGLPVICMMLSGFICLLGLYWSPTEAFFLKLSFWLYLGIEVFLVLSFLREILSLN